jgi:ribosomal protein S18 acetylase RimI-like enzyme
MLVNRYHLWTTLFLTFFIWTKAIQGSCYDKARLLLSPISTIHPLSLGDRDQTIKLIQKYFADSEDKLHLKLIRNDVRGSLGDPRYKKIMNGWYKDGWIKYFISKDPETQVVQAVLGLYKSKEDHKEALWITSLVVNESARGLGLGRALITFAEDYALTHQVSYLRLYTSDEPYMESAQALYDKMGYVITETIPQSFNSIETGHMTYLRQKKIK